MRAVTHLDGNPRNNDISNLAIIGTDDNARRSTLSATERATLSRLLARRGLLAVTMALADMTTAAEVAHQAAVLRRAKKGLDQSR